MRTVIGQAAGGGGQVVGLSLSLLGPFEAAVGGISLGSFRTKNVQALLIYLACQPGQAHQREGLMALLWPDLPQESEAANLRQTLYLLRKTIPAIAARTGEDDVSFVIGNRKTVQVNPEAAVEVDVLSFDRLLREGIECYEQAVALYRGDFLSNFYLPDSAPFEEWVLSWRGDLQRRVLDALSALAVRCMRSRDFGAAVRYARKQIAIDNLHEPAYRQLIEALALSGRRTEAAGQYAQFASLLKTELDMEPPAELQTLYRRIRTGRALDIETDLPPGRGYALKEEIGAGAYGIVYRAEQTAAGRDVAVKIILPKFASQPDFAARFEAEAQMVARLEHPHIVPLYDTWRDESGAHLVMRLMRGGSLKDLLKTGPLELSLVAKLAGQIGSALDAVHKQGIVHRDLKPSNILLDEEGNAYLSDFGIAKNLAAKASLTPSGAVVGTPDYIAPEQIRGEEITTQADQYSLGLVLFETLTGHHPFASESIATLFHKHLNEPLPLVSELRPELPAEIDSILQRGTDKFPDQRYPDIDAFSEMFSQLHFSFDKPAGRKPETEALATPEFLKSAGEHEGLRQPFVAREKELEQLTNNLRKVLETKQGGLDQGNVTFITGNAGSGKTSLLQAFSNRAQSLESDLLVAWGACNAFSGRGDPYLPFRDIINSLTGDVERAWHMGTVSHDQIKRLWQASPDALEILVKAGPDLIDTFIPGSTLLNRSSTILSDRAELRSSLSRRIDSERKTAGKMEQAELFQQYTEVLIRLAERYPLVLVVDDLQWADAGSIQLLFHIGRRLSGSPVLLLGAYRPEDLYIKEGEQHPLKAILDEFKRAFGDIWLDLNQSPGNEFIDRYLDTEPNRLESEFRHTLYERTDGHPLFTVELLRDLQERGDLIRDKEGAWVESEQLEWFKLPARIEGVIEERINRLGDSLREILSVAAVEGEEFTSQVLSRVLEIPERKILRVLSHELDRRHHLVHEGQALEVGDNLLTRFIFNHSLFQQYLYDDLISAERQLLHREIAQSLEEIYSGNITPIIVRLARHYAEGGERDKAVHYLLEAGDQARAFYAHDEAIQHYSQALGFLQETADREEAARTWLKLGLVYHNAFRFEEARQAYDQGFAMWQRIQKSPLVYLKPAPHAARICLGGPVPTLDPGLANDIRSVALCNQLFSGLMTLSSEGDVIPDVAQEWQVLDDGRKYVFKLRDDVFWSDGVRVKAGDFEYAWKRVLDPTTESSNASVLSTIKGAEEFNTGRINESALVGVDAVDDTILVVEMNNPVSFLPQLLCCSITYPVPRHIVEKHGQSWTEPKLIVTNGPFLLRSQSDGGYTSFRLNPAYHGTISGNVRDVHVYERFIAEDPGQLWEMYEEGKLDALTIPQLPSLPGWNTTKQMHAGEYLQASRLASWYLGFNIRRPPFIVEAVRQAFAMAVDQETLVNVTLNGNEDPALGGLVPRGMPGHSPNIAYSYNPGRARTLLDSAGHEDGSTLSTLTLTAYAVHSEIVHYLQDQWKRVLGVDVECRLVDYETWLKYSFEPMPGDMFILGWIADYPDPDSFLRTSSFGVNTGWSDDQFDHLIREAGQNQDTSRRMALYREADTILVKSAAIVPLTYSRWHLLLQPWVKKFPTTGFLCHYWKDVIIEPH